MEVFLIIGHLLGEFTGDRGSSHKRPVMRSFDILFVVIQVVEQTFKLPVVWDSMNLVWRH